MADASGLRLERRVAAYMRRHDVLRKGERVLLLLSGGADSMALLDLLPRVGGHLRLSLRFAALHVHYGARGADSDRDHRIVVEACAAAGVPLHELRLPQKLEGGDFQARARALRYERARALAASEGYDVVVTAHNRDDQAETVLYRLAKYATPQGLAGMRPRGDGIARPLLCLGAAEIRAYCRARDIPYGDDVTNALPVYARNLIRLEVLPPLRRVNPRVAETIAAGAELAADQDAVLSEVVAAARRRVLAPPLAGELLAVDLARLRRETSAVQALLLHGLVREQLGGEALVERRAVGALLRLATRADDAGRVVLRGRLEAVRGGGMLRLRRRTAAHACKPAIVDLEAPAVAAGEELVLAWCGRRFRLRIEPGTELNSAAVADPIQAYLALPPDARCLTLRHPRRGDRFAPLGLGATTTVARFLAAARVAPEERRRALVLDVDGAVAWVGYGRRDEARCGRVADSFRVHESTASVVHVVEEDT